MNFQEKLFETTADLRSRAAEFAQAAVHTARVQAEAASKRAEKLKGSLDVINDAGRELNKVARRHGSQFLKQNSSLVAKVRDEVTSLARSTFASLQKSAAPKSGKTTSRKRKAKAKSKAA
jgi:hypothetical protein